jgi:8-oxo-dGTP pyrophosphatase MutT (NUDIX family)
MSPKAQRAGAKAREQEVSAGGVVVRGDRVVVIVPTRRAADGSSVLALPKGHVDPGESAIQAATREVREETGIVAEPMCELGLTRYWYRRDGHTVAKAVHFFLFTYLDGDTADHDHEVEHARWIGLDEAQQQLTYPAERDMVARAVQRLGEQRAQRLDGPLVERLDGPRPERPDGPLVERADGPRPERLDERRPERREQRARKDR